MVKMYQKSQVVIGRHSFSTDLGVVQGGVLSPIFFNVYLEEALGTTEKLREMVNRGDLLAFADDMLILTNSNLRCLRPSRGWTASVACGI